jgi:hypothetical protein
MYTTVAGFRVRVPFDLFEEKIAILFEKFFFILSAF